MISDTPAFCSAAANCTVLLTGTDRCASTGATTTRHADTANRSAQDIGVKKPMPGLPLVWRPRALGARAACPAVCGSPPQHAPGSTSLTACSASKSSRQDTPADDGSDLHALRGCI